MFVKSPISWSLSKVLGSSNEARGEFVMLDALKVREFLWRVISHCFRVEQPFYHT